MIAWLYLIINGKSDDFASTRQSGGALPAVARAARGAALVIPGEGLLQFIRPVHAHARL
jgi:hypothetical protein